MTGRRPSFSPELFAFLRQLETADHPLIEDLKRKDHVAHVELSQEEALAPGFLGSFTRRCATAAPYVRWLCEAVGVPF